jgi:glutamate racemase
VALDVLASTLPVPVIGVVEPGARALVRVTHNGKVGVIGTVGTIASGAYNKAVERTAAEVVLSSAACPGFVEFVERDQLEGDEVTSLASQLLAPLKAAGVDSLLLGCTHYPYLAPVIQAVMGEGVVLVSSANETAFAVRDLLESQAIEAPAAGSPAKPWTNLGVCQMRQGDLDGAEKSLTRATYIDANNSLTNLTLAQLYYKRREYHSHCCC